MLRTFFRSAIHATDSTLIGCIAKRAAIPRLRQTKPVALNKMRNKITTLAACRRTLIVCGASGLNPNSSASKVCESHVTGFQSDNSVVVKAQVTVFQLSPARTCGLSTKYAE